jgi:hypothetical protein
MTNCHGCGDRLQYADKNRGASRRHGGVLCPTCATLADADPDEYPR